MGEHWFGRHMGEHIGISRNGMQDYSNSTSTLGTIIEMPLRTRGKQENAELKTVEKSKCYFDKICQKMPHVYIKLLRWQLSDNKHQQNRQQQKSCRTNKENSHFLFLECNSYGKYHRHELFLAFMTMRQILSFSSA